MFGMALYCIISEIICKTDNMGVGSEQPGLNHWGDITVVVIYFVLVLAVGFWVSTVTR